MDVSEQYRDNVRRLLGGQDAPLINGYCHILSRCPQCGRVWLQCGPTPLLHLTDAEVSAWAAHLHADLARLPSRACRPCQIRVVGGEFALDEYRDAQQGTITGYGVSWECAQPAQHLLVSAILGPWLERQEAVPAPSVVTDAALAVSVLHFLASQPVPARSQPYEASMRALLTHTNPPGAHAPGTTNWTWHGRIWTAPCQELGGEVMISLAQALPPDERFTLAAALPLWRQITLHALQFRFEGI